MLFQFVEKIMDRRGIEVGIWRVNCHLCGRSAMGTLADIQECFIKCKWKIVKGDEDSKAFCPTCKKKK
jgi:hypothetical protein